jgi:hypothetical protein
MLQIRRPHTSPPQLPTACLLAASTLPRIPLSYSVRRPARRKGLRPLAHAPFRPLQCNSVMERACFLSSMHARSFTTHIIVSEFEVSP